MTNRRMNRRDFVKGTAATAGAAITGGLAGCADTRVQPSAQPEPGHITAASTGTAESKARVLGANERVRMAVIGVGGMGGGHLRSLVRNSTGFNCEVVAVSDLFTERLDYAKAHAACDGYLTYEDVLDRKDVDAVLIAVPDHWHAQIAIDAMNAGKDVYLEKPMTYTAEEALDVRDGCDRTGAVVQVGTQYTSMDCYWRARQAIADKKIGKVIWCQSSFARNSRDGEWNYHIHPKGNEKTIDWKRFLGSRPYRSFDAERFFRWRKFWDYSGGIATDLFFHRLAPLLMAIGPSFPMRVTAGGGIWDQKDREVPDTFFMTIDYPGEFTICLLSTMCNNSNVDTCIHGRHGTMKIEENDAGGKIRIRAQDDFKDEFKQVNEGKDEVEETKLGGNYWYDDHMINFLECVRTRNKPNCDVRLGCMTMVAVAAGVKGYRENRVIKVDPNTGRFI